MVYGMVEKLAFMLTIVNHLLSEFTAAFSPQSRQGRREMKGVSLW